MQKDADKTDTVRIDPRMYLGIIAFRWKLIAICFLYCLLAGVVYLEFVATEYLTRAVIMIYRDPNTTISGQSHLWEEAQTHVELLQSEAFKDRISGVLAAQWAPKVGRPGNLKPPVRADRIRGATGISIAISIASHYPAFARAYIDRMIEEFHVEREAVKDYTSKAASKVLEEELTRLEDKIRAAEDEVIEFQRINNMEYVQAKGALELGYLHELMSRHQSLSTERWMIELQFPRLKGASANTIQTAMDLTRATGLLKAPRSSVTAFRSGGESAAGGTPSSEQGEDKIVVVEADSNKGADETSAKDPMANSGWQDLRLRLARLKADRDDMAAKLQPEHPQFRALDDEIAKIEKQLGYYADLAFQSSRERYDALLLQIDALEEAQRRWKNSYLLASRKGADLRHLELVVTRLEGMYSQLYSKLNDLRVEEEINAEHFKVISTARTDPKPVWPDPVKILIAALMAGIGAGLGLALMIHTFDNKVQSISDVEATIGIPFLGGIPFWVQSEMTGRIRPIVSEEQRSGAAEAYRALRTNVLSALEKAGKRIVMVTSADSKEGKTLTTLNLAIMIAKAGKKVLLLDMDLRRGVLHKSFEMERSPGLTDVLLGKSGMADIIRQTAFDNLWFAAAGATERNTSELLHINDMRAFFNHPALAQYDYVVMDTAPVLRATDTVVLAAVPGCTVVYVAHSNRTPKPMIRYSLDMLGDAHVLGLIVNSIEMHKISSLYYTYQYPNYAYYSYAYAYGYDYYLYDGQGQRAGREHQRNSLSRIRQRLSSWWRRNILSPG